MDSHADSNTSITSPKRATFVDNSSSNILSESTLSDNIKESDILDASLENNESIDFNSTSRISFVSNTSEELPNELINRKKLSSILKSSLLSNSVETVADIKSMPILPGSFLIQPPNWHKSIMDSLNLMSVQKKTTEPLDELLPSYLYGEWYHNVVALFVTAIGATIIAKLNIGIGGVFVFCFLIATYYRTSVKKYRQNTRNAIQREVAKLKMEADEESVEWMNSFMHKFWLTFEPVLSALVVENVENYIPDYLPPFLDSIRISTFTLGSKPFRIDTVKTYLNPDPDTVCMDCRISFIPHDVSDLTKEELDHKINPKIVLNINATKQVGIPIVVEDMTFTGHLRLKIKLFGRFPFAKLIEASFLEKPDFDYTLKPLGTDSLGFDINLIPGLSSFIRDQVHNILSPFFYFPNVFTFDVEKFFAGDFDLNAANGVLAITVYSANSIKNVDQIIDEPPNTYIRFYLDHGQELDRTSICERSFSPKWNETRYLKLNNLNSLLSLELNASKSGLKDKRLGTASFDLSRLHDQIHITQEELNLLILRNGKQISDLRLDIRYLPISKPIKRDDGTFKPPAESNTGILRLTVHECRNLIFSQKEIHPYIRVIVNGIEKAKTVAVKKETNPKYEFPYEMFILDKTSVFIRAEVRDAANQDNLLGIFTSYLTEIIHSQESNQSWWDILNDDEVVGNLRFSAEWKSVIMSDVSDYVGAQGYKEPSIGVIRFTFWEAHDLRNVENVTNGKSDPYVRVLSGPQIRAHTKVKDNDLNPEWGESVYVPVHSLKENFMIEIVDWNSKTRDKIIGATEFKTEHIVMRCIGDQSVNPDIWYISKGEKYDRCKKLWSIDKRRPTGELHYSAEFFPVLSLPRLNELNPATESGVSTSISGSNISELPIYDLHNSLIRYTPDDLIALNSYNSGVLKIKIHEVQFSNAVYGFCQVVVDSLLPLYKTAKVRGSILEFNETADAFIKEVDFSRIAIEVKSAYSNEKDSQILGHWIDTGANIRRRIMKYKRSNATEENDGFWFYLVGTDGPARIRLSFDYIPLSNFVLNPDESLDNQGELTVELLSAEDLMAADKTGTSDPYVIFTVNGEKVFTSDTIRKTLNPKWTGQRFSVTIESRVTASIRIEVFDWNQVHGDVSIGSGGITIRGDAVESFRATLVNIPLDGIAGVSGSVKARFTWHPHLLSHKKSQTSVLGTKKTYLQNEVNLEAHGPLKSTFNPHGIVRSSTENSIISNPSSSLIGNQSLEAASILSFDSTASPAPSTMDDQRDISDATGRAGLIKINILEARGLKGVDKSGTSDPFVRVKVAWGQVYKTKTISKNLSPKWNESFKYSVGSDPFLFDFKVKDHNKMKSAVDLGQLRFNIWDIIKLDVPGGDVAQQWLPLDPPGSGELLLDIMYTPTV